MILSGKLICSFTFWKTKLTKTFFVVIFALILWRLWSSENFHRFVSFLTVLRWSTSFTIFFILVALAYFYIRTTYSYWDTLGVPCSKPYPIVGHTLRRLGVTMHILEFYNDIYYNHNGKDFSGIYEFLKPGLVVGNLELIRNITSKDFDHFANRRVFPLGKSHKLVIRHLNTRQITWKSVTPDFVKENEGQVNPIANEMLSNATGEHWRRIRSTVSPVFTSHKLKQLYPLICQQGNEFVKLLDTKRRNTEELEMRELCGQFTMDTIASCAFGIECHAMNSDRAAFAEMASKIFVLSPARALKIIILLSVPFLAHWGQVLGIDFTSEEFHFFRRVVTETVRLRAEKGIRRGDFLDLMRDTNKLSETAMTAQAILFLLAGHNNTASALSFTMHLLAVNQDVQERLRKELLCHQKSANGDIDYEVLQKLPLLDSTIKEALRLYPADPNLERVCTKDYRIPGTNVTVREGQCVTIPIWAIHHDPRFWPQPDSFNPDRFMNPSTWDCNAFMPFGNGPRQCIGMKFVYLVAKVGIQKILCSYRIVPSANTVHPPPLSPRGFLTTQPLNGLPMSLVPLDSI